MSIQLILVHVVSSRKKFDDEMAVWVYGPQFLRHSTDQWPKNIEVRVMKEVLMTTDELSDVPKFRLLQHILCYYSSLSKLLRVLAHLVCFMENVHLKTNPSCSS
jgi:hypothetical protein